MRIYKSTFPSVPTPEESIFTHLFTTTFAQYPSTLPAYTDAASGFTITRGELKQLAFSLGYGLRHELARIGGVSLARNETIMIFSPNSIAWPVMLFGSLAGGLKTTLANSSYTARELEHQWKDSGAKALFVHPSSLPTVLEMFKSFRVSETEVKKRVIIADFGMTKEERAQVPAGYLTISDLLGKGSLKEEEKFPGKQARETAYLCYSSGTTGKPKGVEVRHRDLYPLVPYRMIAQTDNPRKHCRCDQHRPTSLPRRRSRKRCRSRCSSILPHLWCRQTPSLPIPPRCASDHHAQIRPCRVLQEH